MKDSSVFNLNGQNLNTALVVNLARDYESKIAVDAAAQQRVEKHRRLVDAAMESGKTVYGVNTGFGYLSDVKIPLDRIEELQVNLVRSHACGVGEALDADVSRAMLLIKAAGFLHGLSGVRLELIEQITTFFNEHLCPIIPSQGSVGASGDLAPLAHLALALMGEGEIQVEQKRLSAREVLKEKNIKPLQLKAKEGLSLINGTQFMSAVGSFAVEEAKLLCQSADVIAALSLDGMRGTLRAFDARIHAARPHSGQQETAQSMLQFFAGGDEIMDSHADCGKVQDPYSFRCIPQVHGASKDALQYIESVLNRELNATTDNPLVFDDGDLISGGNFHGQPIAMALDFLAIAMSEIGSISERRTEKLTNPNMSGLPAFIMQDSGLNSGFMIPHVVAAALVSENKVLSHPAVVDSIPTSADKEDHVSMGPIAAMKARKVNRNVANILAVELLAACQALDLLKPLKPSSTLKKVYDAVRSHSAGLDKDRSLHTDMQWASDWILSGGLLKVLNS